MNEAVENAADTNDIDQGLNKSTVSTNTNDYKNINTFQVLHSPTARYTTNHFSKHRLIDEFESNDVELYMDSNSRSSGDLADTEMDMAQNQRYSRHFTLSPETTDYDSNCGDLDSSSNDLNGCIGINSHYLASGALNSGVSLTDFSRLYTSMPVLEDGLSSGHASDTENNNPVPYTTSASIAITATNPTTTTSQITNCFDSKYVHSNSGKLLNPTPISSATSHTAIATQAKPIELVDVLSVTSAHDAALNKEPDVTKTTGESG